jgi:hypothetical protein
LLRWRDVRAKEDAEKVPFCKMPLNVDALASPTNDFFDFFDSLISPKLPPKRAAFKIEDFFSIL